MNLKRNRQSSWLIVALAVLLTGCTAGQSAQPAATEVPSTDQVSAPATVPVATEEPATAAATAPATAAPAASPMAATPRADAATPVASVATPVAAAATPVASEPEVIIVRLGRAASELAPGNDLVLHTITFQPGSSLLPHAHPGETIFYLESGTLSFTLVEGEAKLVRGSNAFPSGATPAATDAVSLGVEIEVNAGDTLYYDETAVQTERNSGTEDAVAIVINQRGVEEARIIRVQEASTPAATPIMSGSPVP